MASKKYPLLGWTLTEPVTITGSSANGWYYLGATVNGANIDYSLQHEESGNIVATVENVAVGDATLNFGAYGTFALDLDDSVDQATIITKCTGDEYSTFGFEIYDAADPPTGSGVGKMGMTFRQIPVNGFTIIEEPCTITGSAANGWYFLKETANGANIDYSLQHEESGNIVATVENVAIGDATLNFGAFGTFALDFDDSVDQATIVAECTGDEYSTFGFEIYDAGPPMTFTIGAKTFSMADAVGEIAPGITLDLSCIDWHSIIDLASARTAVFGEGNTSGSVTVAKSLVIQTGANAYDTFSIPIGDMSADALGLSGSNIATRPSAAAAITAVQNAIVDVAAHRATLGAMQNRLYHKISNLDTSAENLQDAESRIRDVDMAEQMTEYMTQNILVQAATAMLSQANSAPRNVLSLLANAV